MELCNFNRRSTCHSLTNTEKIVLENIKSCVNENQNNKLSERIRKLLKEWDKLVYTFCILVNYLNYGIISNLFSPSMVDMKFIYKTSIANVIYCTTLGGVGYITGSLAGFLYKYKYMNRQISFAFWFAINGIFVAMEPIGTALWQLYLFNFLNGMGGAVFDSGNTVWVVEMWGENSAPVFQLSQMMYGIGSIIGPLMVSPFLYGDLSNGTDSFVTRTTNKTNSSHGVEVTTISTVINTTSTFLNKTSVEDINYSVDRRSSLITPFLTGGGISLSIPLLLLVMFFIKKYKIPEKQTQTLTEKKVETNFAIIGERDKMSLELPSKNRKILIGLVALSLSAYSALEITFFCYSPTYYQYLPIHLSAETAAHVMSVMTASYAFGRGVSAYISTRLKPEVMLTYHMIIIAISTALLHFGQHSEALIYTGNALIGFGFSAMWPSYFSFSENHIKLTDRVTSIYSFLSCLLLLGMPFILGPLIEKHPQVFLQILILLFTPVIILFMIMMVIVKRSRRYPILYTVNN